MQIYDTQQNKYNDKAFGAEFKLGNSPNNSWNSRIKFNYNSQQNFSKQKPSTTIEEDEDKPNW